MAVLKDPSFAKKVKHVYAMGGAGFTPGNITPLSEFNFYVDAEAANIVIQSGLPLTVTGWEIGILDTCLSYYYVRILCPDLTLKKYQDEFIAFHQCQDLGEFFK
ncbi:nucleoside hydrolase [Xenorhabdus cabanillasii]|uniref:nucleoside hydrolase n=1 Tax=Xenorhabdus cabanillasii TaxID=351673 RepID=UPI002B404412|nr:nucleoside hydrolase [Xenorhabdus sp. Flor]